jgi:hypothetical protein
MENFGAVIAHQPDDDFGRIACRRQAYFNDFLILFDESFLTTKHPKKHECRQKNQVIPAYPA